PLLFTPFPYTTLFRSLILILGTLSIFRTPTDIFPNIDIPVVSIIWNYTGLSPTEMSNRIITLQERNLTTIVNDIEHIESQSLNGDRKSTRLNSSHVAI